MMLQANLEKKVLMMGVHKKHCRLAKANAQPAPAVQFHHGHELVRPWGCAHGRLMRSTSKDLQNYW